MLLDRIKLQFRRNFSLRNGAALDSFAKLWIVALSVIVYMTVGDYGVTWDEGYHVSYGSHLANYYGTGFKDQTALTYRNDYLYGGGFDLFGAIFRRTLAYSLEKYTGIHIFGAMVGLVGVIGTWKLGKLLGGSITGLFSVILISLTPVYYGHMFNNPKDLPFAVGYVWSLYYILRVIRESPILSRELALRSALAIGLSMSVRIAGLLLLVMLLAGVGLEYVVRRFRNGSWEQSYRTAQHHFTSVMGIVIGAWCLMLVLWPWAMLDPIRRPVVALLRMSKFMSHHRKMPFNGEMISTLDVPSDYLLHYFGYKIPEFIIVMCIVGLGFAFAKLFLAPVGRLRIAWGVLIFAAVFPPFYAVLKESPLYDGLRHFLFIVPVICVLAAVGLTALVRVGRNWLRWTMTSTVTALIFVFSIDQIHTMAAIHPHQYVWFNRFVGGLEEAVELYDTDYYGESYKEALESLPPYLWENEREKYLNTVYQIKGCFPGSFLNRYLPPNFAMAPGKKRKYDFFTGYRRSGCMKRHQQRPVVREISVQGGVINVVRDMRNPTSNLEVKAKKTPPSQLKSKEKPSPPSSSVSSTSGK